MSARRWVIMRHAEAEPPGVVADHERPLTSRGHRQAAGLGAVLRREGLRPDHVLCSTALRARQTLHHALGVGEGDRGVEVTDRLYSADVDEAFELVCQVDSAVATLALVGHNPTVARLYEAFPAPDAAPRPPGAFPPAAAAVVALEVDWLYAAPGTGTATPL